MWDDPAFLVLAGGLGVGLTYEMLRYIRPARGKLQANVAPLNEKLKLGSERVGAEIATRFEELIERRVKGFDWSGQEMDAGRVAEDMAREEAGELVDYKYFISRDKKRLTVHAGLLFAAGEGARRIGNGELLETVVRAMAYGMDHTYGLEDFAISAYDSQVRVVRGFKGKHNVSRAGLLPKVSPVFRHNPYARLAEALEEMNRDFKKMPRHNILYVVTGPTGKKEKGRIRRALRQLNQNKVHVAAIYLGEKESGFSQDPFPSYRVVTSQTVEMLPSYLEGLHEKILPKMIQ